jgi:transaldolase/transaldolase/glucose-6-phosphate isomerase
MGNLKYVEALIGPNTVNTLPLETLEAYRDHGNPKAELTHEIDKSKLVFQQLLELNINIDQLTQQLEKEGIDKFSKSYDQLIETLTKKMK